MKWLTALFRRRRDPADNYTPRAQKLLKLARQQADRRHHGYVGTDHLLLALLDLREGIGFAALQALGWDLDQLRQAVEASSQEGEETELAPTIPLTPRARHVLKMARTEARKLGHDYVGTEHLLLGLLQERRGFAPQVLQAHAPDLEQVRRIVLSLSPPAPETPPTQSRIKT